MPRPCPFVSCRHHLFVEVKQAGGMQYSHGLDEGALATMQHTCSLDVAALGPRSLHDVAALMNMTGSRAQQVEAQALRKLKAAMGEDTFACRSEPLPETAYSVATNSQGQRHNDHTGSTVCLTT